MPKTNVSACVAWAEEEAPQRKALGDEERSKASVDEVQNRGSSVQEQEKDKKQTKVVSRSMYIQKANEEHRAQKAGCRKWRAS